MRRKGKFKERERERSLEVWEFRGGEVSRKGGGNSNDIK